MKNTKVNCRPEGLIGSWLIEQDVLDQLESNALAIIESQQLEAVAERSRGEIAEQQDEPYKMADGIAQFSVSGMLTKYPTSFQAALGGTSYLLTQRAFDAARTDPSVKAGFMVVDSPGGTILGVMECARAIRRFAGVKPLHVHITGMGTSAAYWLAIQGSYLTADPSALVGSVGAMAVLTDRSKQLANQGIKKIIVANKGATRKGMSQQAEVTDAHREEIQEMLGDLVAPFVADVKKLRDLPDSKMDEIVKAGSYVANKGMDIGLIDGIAFTDQAYDHLREKVPGGFQSEDAKGIITSAPKQIERQEVMALTTEQVAKLNKIPAFAQATAENGFDLIFTAFEKSGPALEATKAELTARDTTIADLNTKLNASETKLAAAVKPAPTARETELLGKIAKSSRDSAIKAGAVTPAVADVIASNITDPEMQGKVFESLAGNKPVPPTGEGSGAQVLADPNKPGPTATAKAVADGADEAKKFQDEQLRSRGLLAK